METITRAHRSTGWQQEETDRLLAAVRQANADGLPLRSVFEEMSVPLGRKSNSIRNHYYTCIRSQPDADVLRNPPTRPFTAEETHDLLRRVLMARGQGMSVRACVMSMAEGDRSLMLRYQNKYRTMLRQHPEMITAICQELQAEGLPSPELAGPMHPEAADPTFLDPDDDAAARLMAEPCITALLEGLKELLHRAAGARRSEELLHQLDCLRVEHDLQRLLWEKDFTEATNLLSGLLSLLREFLALPPEQQLDRQSVFQEALLTTVAQAEAFLTRTAAAGC